MLAPSPDLRPKRCNAGPVAVLPPAVTCTPQVHWHDGQINQPCQFPFNPAEEFGRFQLVAHKHAPRSPWPFYRIELA